MNITPSAFGQQPNQSNSQENKLNALTYKTDTVIYRTQAVFPFDLFPDEIVIDLEKVSITFKQFFYSEQIYPVLINDIEGVVQESSYFFSTLKVQVSRLFEEPLTIRYLKNQDAYRVKTIIMGLVTCYKEGIDTSKISHTDLLAKLEGIGATKPSPGSQFS